MSSETTDVTYENGVSPHRLSDHRRALHRNPRAYEEDIETGIGGLVTRLADYLRKDGELQINLKRHRKVLQRAVQLIFDAQDRRPMFHVEGTELPLCWNHPKNWHIDYIKYEWGHLKSLNQEPQANRTIRSFALYSARCNNHIQTSLHLEELMVYGGILAQRIASVLTSRRKLFESKEWRELEGQLTLSG
jgi:hypothetical protein